MGKGDKRRPTAIDDGSFGLNWCRAMGHKMRESSEVCINCGMTAREIVEHQELVQPATRRRRKQSSAKDAQ